MTARPSRPSPAETSADASRGAARSPSRVRSSRWRPSAWAAAFFLVEAGWAALVLALPVLAWVSAGRSWWITALATFHLYFYAPLALPLLVSLLRRRFLAHLPAWIAAAVFFWQYGGQLLPAPPPPGEEALRVMTYNVARYQRDDAAVVAEVRRVAPDVLALQEVADAAHRDRLLELLAAEGMRCEQRPYFDGSRGVGIAICAAGGLGLDNVQRRTYHAEGQWSYVFAELRWHDRTINLVAPHFLAFRISAVDPMKEARTVVSRVRDASQWHRQEGRALLALVRNLEDPTLLVGDFNSTPYQAVHIDFRRHLQDAFREAGFGFGATFDYYLPLRIDYVYASQELEVRAARVGNLGPSDHRPVIAEVVFRDAAAGGGGS